MIWNQDANNSISFEVRVVPRSSKSEIIGEHDGALKIKIASAPVDNAANEELIKLLSKTFGVSKMEIEIVSGQSSKRKMVRIKGADANKIAAVLQSKS
jgi:uncharacterized protein (TIGR00251 family)